MADASVEKPPLHGVVLYVCKVRSGFLFGISTDLKPIRLMQILFC